MKWDCGETRSEKWARLSEWHEWYAWYPVRVGSHDCRWLERVERRLVPEYEWVCKYYRPLLCSP